MAGIELRHDLLDAQLVDRQQQNIGRCDAVVLEVREGRPMRVAAVLIGGPVREERVGRWLTAFAAAVRAVFRMKEGGISRIPFDAMRVIDDVVQLDVDRRNLPSEHVERWLAEHVVCRIPGGAGDRK